MNYGYAGGSFGEGAGFFNVRPDMSATPPNPSLRFMTNNIQRMIITDIGNVGFNTTSPERTCLITANGTYFNPRMDGSGAVSLNNPGPDFAIIRGTGTRDHTDLRLGWSHDADGSTPNDVMNITDQGLGNVGIGASSPGGTTPIVPDPTFQLEVTPFAGIGGAIFAHSNMPGFATITGRNEGTPTTTGGVSGLLGAVTSSSGAHGVEGHAPSGSYAGAFYGDTTVSGTFSATTKFFRIDHPTDPANKFLNHASVESSEMKNMYDGVVALDANGAATVQLPSWFGIINHNFRYQLTPIGASMPSLYVSGEVSGNQFNISGGAPNGKVSWQVTGIRQDPYANANPMQVEQDKPADQKGFYLHPELYGQPKEKTLGMTLERELPKPPPHPGKS
jgi:hypothetical protein